MLPAELLPMCFLDLMLRTAKANLLAGESESVESDVIFPALGVPNIFFIVPRVIRRFVTLCVAAHQD
jgi:hypothetical protein